MNSSVVQLENKIKSVLISKKIQPTPETIVNAAFETIIELSKRNQNSFEDLIHVIQNCRFFKLSKTCLMGIEVVCRYYPAMAAAILKQFFKNMTEPIKILSESCSEYQLLNILLKNCKSKAISNIITKNFEFIEYFYVCDKEQKINLFLNGIDAFGEHVDSCFKDCISLSNSSNIILIYLTYKFENNMLISFSSIKEIIELLEVSQSNNYKIIYYLLHFNNMNMNQIKISRSGLQSSQNKTVVFEKIFNPKFVNLIKDEFFNTNNDEDKLLDICSLLANSLLPDFIPLIIELNEAYLKDGKFVKILKSIISSISIPDFIDIVGNFDIITHHKVLKGISNVDISVFIQLYKIYGADTEFANKVLMEINSLNLNESNANLDFDMQESNEVFNCKISKPGQESLDCLLSCLPQFCYYCSDHENNIKAILIILVHHLETHRSIVCNALEKLLQSHSNNLQSINTLPNPIPREQSTHIINQVISSGIVYNVIAAFQKTNNIECDAALQLLVDFSDVNISNELVSAIHSDNHKTVVDSLRLLVFFVKKLPVTFDFISNIIELCFSTETDIQKKAYYLLYKIYSLGCSQFCICEYVFYTLEKAVQLPSQKNRALLQYTIIQRECVNCKATDKVEMQTKFLREILKNLKVGNMKCKKLIKEIVITFCNDVFFRDIFISFLSSKNNDNDVLVGSLECSLIILEHITQNVEYIDRNNEYLELNTQFCIDIVQNVIDVALYSVDVVRVVINIFKLVINSKLLDRFENIIALTIDAYISQFSKKFNRELKEFCFAAQKTKFGLTKAMKTLLKFKNKSGKEKEIKVVSKTDFNKLL